MSTGRVHGRRFTLAVNWAMNSGSVYRPQATNTHPYTQWRNFGLKSGGSSTCTYKVGGGSVPHSKKWGSVPLYRLKLRLCLYLLLVGHHTVPVQSILARVSIAALYRTRYCYMLSFCMSVRPSVRHTLVLYHNGYIHRQPANAGRWPIRNSRLSRQTSW